MRMVPPGYTSEQAVYLRQLRYTDLPASTTPHQGSQGPRGNGKGPGDSRAQVQTRKHEIILVIKSVRNIL